MRLRLNAAQLSALYALRGTINHSGDLDVEQWRAGRLLRVAHPDGRVWYVTRGGGTKAVAA